MEPLLLFFILFVSFMVVWIVALLISRSISKKRLRKFKIYLQENFPHINLQKQEILIARQKSKQFLPDILLLIDETQKEIILITENKDEGITDHRYAFSDLAAVNSSHQIIRRGFFPKTYSYEETLSLNFKDGGRFTLILENLSNKKGDDQGAKVIKEMFAVWQKKLNEIVKN